MVLPICFGLLRKAFDFNYKPKSKSTWYLKRNRLKKWNYIEYFIIAVDFQKHLHVKTTKCQMVSFWIYFSGSKPRAVKEDAFTQKQNMCVWLCCIRKRQKLFYCVSFVAYQTWCCIQKLTEVNVHTCCVLSLFCLIASVWCVGRFDSPAPGIRVITSQTHLSMH